MNMGPILTVSPYQEDTGKPREQSPTYKIWQEVSLLKNIILDQMISISIQTL
jgi:hypothetical protein